MTGAFIDQSLRDVHACAKCDIHPHGKLIEISERLWTSEEAQNLQLDASRVKMAPQSLRFCRNRSLRDSNVASPWKPDALAKQIATSCWLASMLWMAN